MTGLKGLESKIRRNAKEAGLSFDHLIFKQVPPDEINELAAFGLPQRYIHWIFGAQYKDLTFNDKNQIGHILEIVINSVPVIARLSNKNTKVENITTIAHVIGHADFFHNNSLFKKTNKGIPVVAADNAFLIEKLRKQYGKKKIDGYLTALMTVARASMNTHLFSEEKNKSLFYILEEYAPKEKYEEQLYDIVKKESEYLDVIWRTQCINEGWAHFCDAELLRSLLSTDEWTEYSMLSSCMPPPYQLGYTLFSSIKKKYGIKKCLEVRKFYDDITFIQEFLTQDIINTLKIGIIRKEKFIPAHVETVIKEFIREKQYQTIPPITVRNQQGYSSILYLVHYEEENKKLSEKRLPLYLKEVQHIWKKDVHLTIYNTENDPITTYIIDHSGNIDKKDKKK